MRTQRLMIVGMATVLAGSFAFAQVGRGGSQWLTGLGDAQRTSWVRSDDKISVETLSKPGFGGARLRAPVGGGPTRPVT